MEEWNICKYEPFSKFILKRKYSYFKIFIFFIIFLWGLQIVFTLIDGTFFEYEKYLGPYQSILNTIKMPQYVKTYYLTNYNVHINHNFIYSIFIVLFIITIRKIPESIKELVNNNVLILKETSNKDFISYLNNLYNKKIYFYFPLVVVVIVVILYAMQITNINRLTYLVFEKNHIAPYHHYIFLNGLLWYLGLQLFIRVTTTIYLIKKVFTSKDYSIIIQPFHPDNCSGLKPIGDISILVSLLIFLIALGFSLHLSVIIIFQNGSLLEEPINILGLTLYFILSPVIFWSMIGIAHKKMKGEKQRLLKRLRPALHKNYSILFNSLNNDSYMAKRAYDKFLKINILYTHTKKLTVWPFEIETARTFFGIIFSPIMLPIMTETLIRLF